MRNARMLAAVYVGVLAVSAMAVALSGPGGPAPLPGVELATALQSFDACDDALAYFRETAGQQELAWARGEGGMAVEEQALDSAAGARERTAAPAPAATAEDAAGGAFSDTNVQEAGVDEPDLVKTDGRRIVTVTGGRLHVIDVGADPSVLAGSLQLPGDWGQELLLAGDRALVFSTAWSERPAAPTSRPVPGGTPQSVLTLVDLAETATPRVTATLTLDGEYVTARMVDGVARVVLRSHPAGPILEEPVPLPGPGLGAADAGEEARAGTIDAWVPSYRLEGEATPAGDATTTSDRLVECDQIYHPAEFAGMGMVSVLSVDLAGDLTPSAAASVVADAQTVYAAAGTLYVAFTEWTSQGSTQIHAFDITDPTAAVYRGSGAVPGRLLSQWALSEHAGHLRVATTEGDAGMIPVDPVGPVAPGASRAPVSPPASHSAVTVLALQGDELVQVGRVEGLGPDERIYAVRFMGDVGYVVTFRETDPLYTLDLSDPAHPRVLGELKILGYSAYLHPLGEGLLLGVGQDATEQGSLLGTQLSLFDVRDLANPVRTHQTTITDGHSSVEYDHRAFLHWPATRTVVLPVETYPSSGRAIGPEDVFTGALVYTLDPGAGFSEVGRLSHAGRGDDPWMAGIRRSLVVGDTLYTVSETGVQAADLATLAERAWIPLPG